MKRGGEMSVVATALSWAGLSLCGAGCEQADHTASGCSAATRQLEWRANMAHARQHHTATLMHGGTLNGCVVVVGGLDDQLEPVQEIEVFDPGRKQWATLDDEQGPRVFHTATSVAGIDQPYLLIAGGYGPNRTPLDEVLAIRNDGAIAQTATVLPRAEHSATVLADGRVLFIGGGEMQSQILDPDHDITAPGPRLDGPDADRSGVDLDGQIFGHAATRLDEGRVLIAGGAAIPYYPNPSVQDGSERHGAWICAIEAQSCERTQSLEHPRGARAHALGQLIGGDTPGTLVLGGGLTELLDDGTGDWIIPNGGVPPNLPKQAAFDGTAERIVVLGGIALNNQEGTARGDIVRLLERDTDETSMRAARYRHSATLLDDGVSVLVAGGRNGQTSGAGPMSSWEIIPLDPLDIASPLSSRLSHIERTSPLSCTLSKPPARRDREAALLVLLVLACCIARRRRARRMSRPLRGSIVAAVFVWGCGQDETRIDADVNAGANPLRESTPSPAGSAGSELEVAGTGNPLGSVDAGSAGSDGSAGLLPKLSVQWSEVQLGEPRPSSRVLSTLIVDPETNQLMLFGGASFDGGRGDTWLWDLDGGSGWVAHGGESPPVRGHHAIARSEEGNVAILFGGLSDVPLGDTWAWSASRWQPLVADGSGPPARYGHAMVYDAARQCIVLFGGKAEALLGDTWTWTSRDGWTRVCGAAPDVGCQDPPARYLHAMLYDPRSEEVVLYGGRNDEDGLNETWRWNGTSWREEPLSAERLNGLARHSAHTFGYAPNEDVWVVFGGIVDRDQPSPAVWGYSDLEDQIWIKADPPAEDPAPAPPTARAFAPMAWDPIGQRFLIFGGGFSAQYRDLWSLSVTDYASPLRDCLAACEQRCQPSAPGACRIECDTGLGSSACSTSEGGSDAGAGEPAGD